MHAEELEVSVDRDGKVSIRVTGVKGKGCVDLTRPLEDALGAVVEQRTHTAEYHEGSTGQRASDAVKQR